MAGLLKLKVFKDFMDHLEELKIHSVVTGSESCVFMISRRQLLDSWHQLREVMKQQSSQEFSMAL